MLVGSSFIRGIDRYNIFVKKTHPSYPSYLTTRGQMVEHVVSSLVREQGRSVASKGCMARTTLLVAPDSTYFGCLSPWLVATTKARRGMEVRALEWEGVATQNGGGGRRLERDGATVRGWSRDGRITRDG